MEARPAAPTTEQLRETGARSGPARRFSAVMFTDIKDSTAYYSSLGDLAGRRQVQLHDDLLYPIVEEHGGEIVNHTGDGLLAAFDDPRACCRAAIKMQRALARHNHGVERQEDELHVRIAAHAGVGLREGHHLFGSVVNTAARIETVAEGDQILISGALYGHLDERLSKRCAFLQERELRGTGQVHRLYEMTWRAEPPAGGTAPPEDVGPLTCVALCTDVEDSSGLRGAFPASRVEAVLHEHEAVVRAAVADHGGRVHRVAGDMLWALFGDALAACAAAVEVQRRHHGHDWQAVCPELRSLPVRISLAAAPEPEEAAERAARLGSAGHGGQILLTAASRRDVAGCLPEGLGLRDHGVHQLQDQRYSEDISELVVADLPPTDANLRTPRAPEPARRVRIGPAADVPPGDGVMDAVLAAVAGGGRAVTITEGQARALARHKPADLRGYWLSRVVEWSQLRYQLDARFVPLTMLVDRGEDAPGERWGESERPVEDVDDLLGVVREPALVLLGPPGAGKSTILRRLELQSALSALRRVEPDGPVPLFVELNHFKPGRDGELPLPEEWLDGLWAARCPRLGPLRALVDEGRLLFLLDGLNEVPTRGHSDFRRCVRLWKDFVEQVVERAAGNRFVFSCRSLDYSAPLSSPNLRVPQVRVEPMSERQVRQYLKLYSPSHWADIWAEITASDQLDLFQSPFFLKLLVDQVEAEGRMPHGRAGLFTGFVRQSLKRELERDSLLFDDDELVDHRDRRRIVAWRWKDAYALPDHGSLVPLLERLAYGMQETHAGGDLSQVRVGLDDALAIIDHPKGEDVVAAASQLSVLDEASVDDDVLFTHQLVQEYFAARRMAARLDTSRLRAPWRRDEVRPAVGEVIASLAPADPLPPLPGSGWEETAILAAVMADDPSEFVRRVAEVDLVLAGRCAAQTGLDDRLDPAVRGELRQRLAGRSRDRDADLRARVAAGLTLGRLGGPPFELRQGPDGPWLSPPLVPVEGGDYRIGTDLPYRYRGHEHYEETPSCTVHLAPFSIGAFPVTNAEWAWFIEAGGYDDERFWEGSRARAWLRGEGTVVNMRSMARFWRGRFLADPELVEVELRNDRMEPSTYELWHRRLRMDDEQFEQHLDEHYPAGRLWAPRYWDDPRYNNPMQPVIGISCFEAGAYAAWLAAQSGLPYRLPTEVEWEAAARGRAGRRFAYGDTFDPLRGNTVETHLRAPTPVGVFPEGDTPEGAADLTGNTYDLTASLWGDDPITTSYPYPYDPDDGREARDAPVTVSRVGRGGAWYLGEVHARATYRGRDRYDLRADDWLNYRGCRVVLPAS